MKGKGSVMSTSQIMTKLEPLDEATPEQLAGAKKALSALPRSHGRTVALQTIAALGSGTPAKKEPASDKEIAKQVRQAAIGGEKAATQRV